LEVSLPVTPKATPVTEINRQYQSPQVFGFPEKQVSAGKHTILPFIYKGYTFIYNPNTRTEKYQGNFAATSSLTIKKQKINK
jgi:hypothetical protein